MLRSFKIYEDSIDKISEDSKLLINTINAHCYNLAKRDKVYHQALLASNVLLPDGISIVWAIRLLTGRKIKKIAGADLFFYELTRLEKKSGKCFFLGSTEATLQKINEKIKQQYPNITVKTFSPPFKDQFLESENLEMLEAINDFQPDVLMVGMTAPKQEKWAYQNFPKLEVGHICCIGAVFDFYAGTIRRAPRWMIKIGLEWFYRLIKEPRRMWQRYLIGNILFSVSLLQERFKNL